MAASVRLDSVLPVPFIGRLFGAHEAGALRALPPAHQRADGGPEGGSHCGPVWKWRCACTLCRPFVHGMGASTVCLFFSPGTGHCRSWCCPSAYGMAWVLARLLKSLILAQATAVHGVLCPLKWGIYHAQVLYHELLQPWTWIGTPHSSRWILMGKATWLGAWA